MPASSGVRSALYWLQPLHDATVFSQVSKPPRELGNMWSRVSSAAFSFNPQYMQRKLSRLKSIRLVKLLWLIQWLALPLVATIARISMLDCLPFLLLLPPRSAGNFAPASHDTMLREYKMAASSRVIHEVGKPAIFNLSTFPIAPFPSQTLCVFLSPYFEYWVCIPALFTPSSCVFPAHLPVRLPCCFP